MKKNITIILLSIVTLISMGYGYYQSVQANKYREMALENERMAVEMKEKAELAIQEAKGETKDE